MEEDHVETLIANDGYFDGSGEALDGAAEDDDTDAGN